MRRSFDPNLRFGGNPIEALSLDLDCRSPIVPVLRALQHVYGQPALRDAILAQIKADVNPKNAPDRGRPGMDYWQILVLASVRLGCNLTYDELQDLALNHRALRQLMGLSDWALPVQGKRNPFSWQRIQANLCLIKPETIQAISNLIVAEGHRLAPEAAERIRGDSFVVGTNIHHPTDSSLLGDGLRKILMIAPALAELTGQSGWRQHHHHLKLLRRRLKAINMAARKRGRGGERSLCDNYKALFELTDVLLARALQTHEGAMPILLKAQPPQRAMIDGLISDLVYYMVATEHVRGLAVRRMIDDEKIPNAEKIFSIFEPHTELINRGKVPLPIEFGHRVLVLEDGVGFIAYHEVYDSGLRDPDVLIRALRQLQARLDGRIRSASFDCGFHSPENQVAIKEILAHPCLPMRGVKQVAEQNRAATVEFRKARRNHPGIESGIHALQAGNGLDRCRDRHRIGYDRYVALAVLGRNLHVLGDLLIRREAPDALAAVSQRKPLRL
jgi:IS5 family transposase